ncbi:MAG TPA: hypothetical protein VFT64_04465 [Rickettsiales bacterium]|nr:hypothetical protein [Rickettsiales bacterium]
MRRSIIPLAVSLLTACTHAQPVPEPVVVKVPVAIPCSPPPIAEPYWNVVHLENNASDTERLKALLVDMDTSKAYIEELKAQLKACS